MSIFNNIGTVTGLSIKAGLTDENNEAKDMNKSFLVDSLGTIVAGCLGTSIVGTTLETSAGIEEGGQTGLMAVTSAVKAIDFDNIIEAIPAFLTFIIIPLTYSIVDGIMIGILSYVVLNIITGKFKQISLPMYAMGILSLVKMLFL
ncbi:Putative permease YicO [Anaerococcus vaginalis]|uniref:Permease YicO n=2 Tax=Anaerococcus vaginalis TaxID=33037 RepID=A0A6N2STD1_9FIRM